MQRRLCTAIAKGVYAVVAARAAGIHEHTLRRWVEWGESGVEPYSTFCEALGRAEAKAEAAAAKVYREMVQSDPRSMGEYLARRFPERWSPSIRSKVTVTGAIAVGPAIIDPARLEDHELELLEALLAKARPTATGPPALAAGAQVTIEVPVIPATNEGDST